MGPVQRRRRPMTIWDLLAAATQRWGVTLAGLLLTVLAVFWVLSVPEVYSSHVRVVLLPPTSDEPNGYADRSTSLIPLAGAVARSIRGTGDAPESVSGNVTLASEGYPDGFEVRHLNSGGQWKYRFDEPVLDVQAVGESLSSAESSMASALQAVESALIVMQDTEGVSAENRVRTRLNPPVPQFRVEKGSRARAAAASALAGVLLTLGVLGSLGPVRRDSEWSGLTPAPTGRHRRANRFTKSRARESQF